MTRLWPDGEPIEVWGEETSPSGFAWQGETHTIVEVCNRWWQPDEIVWREYLKVVIGGGWLLARLYD
ncbi:MAG: hypothetical protein ACOYZ7_04000 [Chloroflexota bacterium]